MEALPREGGVAVSRGRWGRLRRSWPVVLSALLLILSHPPFDFWLFGWVALVPLLISLDGRGMGAAFGRGVLTGVLFFGATVFWFVTMQATAGIPAVLAVAAVTGAVVYLALYLGAAAAGAVWLSRKGSLAALGLLPCWWVALDLLRDHLLGGFGWLSMGLSQYRVLPVIQIADVTGVFGVTFVVVLVNVAVAQVIRAWRAPEGWSRAGAASRLVLSLGVVGLVLAYGAWRLPVHLTAGPLVTVVQGDIAQADKWQPEKADAILRKYFVLTTQALAQAGQQGRLPDLVIWPETAFPGFVWDNPERMEVVKDFVRQQQVPLLLGLIRREGEAYFNAALLISAQGEIVARHDKQHLVPFGEYLPLRRQLPALAALVPIEDFTAGSRPTIFDLDQGAAASRTIPARFGVLICFEDTVSGVARGLVAAGADFLVNITNDAWFLNRRAPQMHLQAAVLQAVANRRTLVRAANTGISCFVRPSGRIEAAVQSGGRKTFVPGWLTRRVGLDSVRSLYARFGNVFAWLCVLALASGAIFLKNRGR